MVNHQREDMNVPSDSKKGAAHGHVRAHVEPLASEIGDAPVQGFLVNGYFPRHLRRHTFRRNHDLMWTVDRRRVDGAKRFMSIDDISHREYQRSHIQRP
jgi:hypothetical protein